MNKILVTGADGFIGQSLCNELVKRNKKVHGIVRNLSPLKNYNKNIKYIPVGNINHQTNWEHLLSDIDCIVHCAGITQVMKKKNKEKNLYNTNVEGTKKIAIQAAAAGVRRIIFLSSIKVNGEKTAGIELNKSHSINNDKKFFTHLDKPSPKDLYGLSKLKAEEVLLKISNETNLEVTILRLPLVYGKGVKGNLNRIINLIRLGIPLPLGMIKNKRSMIGLDNLIDLIILCITHSKAAGKIFLASDGEDLSTSDLIKYIAFFMGQSSRLFYVPVSILKLAGYILNRNEEINKLVSFLEIDIQFTCETLDWLPAVKVSEGIRRMVQ